MFFKLIKKIDVIFVLKENEVFVVSPVVNMIIGV
jgi:hypothetical protein